MRQQYRQVTTSLNHPKPFVKWAGGKRQLIPILSHHTPKIFGTFFEPFLGGGAMLFHLLSQNPSLKCDVSDLNSDLAMSYITIRDNVKEVISSLEDHSKNYFKNPKPYYYKIRDCNPKGVVEKTSRLLFLNKTCFNGLYRVNRKGKFNVPLGRYTNPNIVNKDNLLAVSRILQSRNILINCKDFSFILDDAKKGDFVYFDPPYQPVSETANFTSYTNKDFHHKDLKRLANLCENLNSKGCKIMLSNSKSEPVAKLFSGHAWKIVQIEANRAINSDSKRRTGHTELLIKNYN